MKSSGRDMTPNPREKDEKEELTGQKLTMEDAAVGSKYESGDHEQNDGQDEQGEVSPQERSNRMKEIEEEVGQIEKRLKEIKVEGSTEKDKYSEKFMDLEYEKGELEKKLIDLSFSHRIECANSIRESRRLAEEEK
jgi:hypothetical protein